MLSVRVRCSPAGFVNGIAVISDAGDERIALSDPDNHRLRIVSKCMRRDGAGFALLLTGASYSGSFNGLVRSRSAPIKDIATTSSVARAYRVFFNNYFETR